MSDKFFYRSGQIDILLDMANRTVPTSAPWFVRARLKTRQLMLLVAIDDEGNIHRAAEILCISQPSASKLLKDLEDVLGVSLFERLPRGMRPTWYGEAMIRHARIVLSSLTQAGSELAALKTGRFGEVSVGAIIGPALCLLPQAVAIVAQQHPDVRVQICVESSDVLMERLRQNKLDIMVGRIFETHDKTNLSYEILSDELVCAVVRPGHPMLGTPALTLKQLQHLRWIVPPMGSVLRHRFDLMFQEAGIGIPSHLIEASSITFITKMLQQSDCVAVVPADIACYYASYGMVTTLPIQLSCTMDAFGIVLRNNWLLSPAAKVLLAALRAAARSTYQQVRETKQPAHPAVAHLTQSGKSNSAQGL
jgi:DNA-binding transcriptional LysR family regulator